MLLCLLIKLNPRLIIFLPLTLTLGFQERFSRKLGPSLSLAPSLAKFNIKAMCAYGRVLYTGKVLFLFLHTKKHNQS